MSTNRSPFNPVLPDKPGQAVTWNRLYGSARSLAIVNAARKKEGPLMVLTRDVKSMDSMLEEISFFKEDNVDFPVLTFPDWETLPYDRFSPYQDIVSDRLLTLSRLREMKNGILLVTVSSVMHRLLPCEYISSCSFRLDKGESVDIDAFRRQLTENGYRQVSQVMEHGDYTFRGSILDVFPMGAESPYRIDLLDDVIDTIRTFDPETQLSREKIDGINVLPASEVSLTVEAVNRFRANWRKTFSGNPALSEIYTDVSNGFMPAGIEYYLPFFYDHTALIFDYLPQNTLLVMDDGCEKSANIFWMEIRKRYDQAVNVHGRPVLPPEDLYISNEDLLSNLAAYSRIFIRNLAMDNESGSVRFASRIPVKLPVDIRAEEPLGVVKQFIDGFEGRVMIVAESAGRRETIMELFRENGMGLENRHSWTDFTGGGGKLCLTVAPLEQGALIDNPAIALVSESELFGERAQQRRLRKRGRNDTESVIRNLAELTMDAPVVHEDHGVGRYKGLVTLEIDGIPGDFIHLEYEGGDKLYVPVSALDLVSRYTGADPDHAPLHRLGSSQWQKARTKAEKRIHDVAAELLELHARRASKQGRLFHVDENEYRSFCQGFPFEETPDQEDAINSVINDMKSARAMDRLICGDAGFGKTEVAMRAAYISVSNNRQVALLVPTTLLAQQHFQNFRDRFADWPVRIETMSRFVTRDEQKQITYNLEDGKIDIVIGTHRLLQDDIRFKDLGLVVIDEEHRFGVRQKEKIKALRAEVDVLTLTATPIPRTLNMAISELRDLSIIATPPSRRLAIKTFVYEWNNDMVQEAIQREIMRGGQVYFLHNEVESIEKMTDTLQSLVPEARARFAHGQMPEKQLEQVMLDFYHRRFNILVCTTIIESGIDVPTANTIVINRADKLGLAQLYQLRGRVGRSHHRAYAYFVVPSIKSITEDARKRLEAVESLEDLGIGFTLAIHDLEIRGAGEILGEEQSGQIHEIGFSLYMELLERAVNALKSGRQPKLDRPLDHGVEINMHAPALIPDDYLPDVHLRLIMYKRIASAKNENDLDGLKEELVDRFGPMPEQAYTLFAVTRLKIRLNCLGVRKIDMGGKGGRILFKDENSIDIQKIIELVQDRPGVYKIEGSDKLRVTMDLPDVVSRLEFLQNLFNMISSRKAA